MKSIAPNLIFAGCRIDHGRCRWCERLQQEERDVYPVVMDATLECDLNGFPNVKGGVQVGVVVQSEWN